jgi:hypothetical protein
MVMLDSARWNEPVPALARWLLGLGIAATLAANVAHGRGHGLIGAAVAACLRSHWWAPMNSSCWLSAVLRRYRMACPAARVFRTRWANKQSRYSLISWQRIVFLRSARSARSSTSASPGRRGCGITSLQEGQGGRKAPLREQLVGGAKPTPRLKGRLQCASNRLIGFNVRELSVRTRTIADDLERPGLLKYRWFSP